MTQATKKYILVGVNDATEAMSLTGLPEEVVDSMFIIESVDELDPGEVSTTTAGVVFASEDLLRQYGCGNEVIEPGDFVIVGLQPKTGKAEDRSSGGPYFRGVVAGDHDWFHRLALGAGALDAEPAPDDVEADGSDDETRIVGE